MNECTYFQTALFQFLLSETHTYCQLIIEKNIKKKNARSALADDSPPINAVFLLVLKKTRLYKEHL